MSNIIILSIHKQHADNVLAGKEIYEFRKNKPNKANLPYLVLLYETQNGGGAGAIVGEFIALVIYAVVRIVKDKRNSTFRRK